MANTSYFSAENSWKRLFFITGKTADEFYMDSGIKMNIEQAIWQRLLFPYRMRSHSSSRCQTISGN